TDSGGKRRPTAASSGFTPSLAVGPRLVHERLGVPRGAPALGTTPTRRQPTVWVMKRCRKSGCSLWIRLACDLAQNNGETGIIGARPLTTNTHRIELLTQRVVPAATSPRSHSGRLPTAS